MKNLGDFAVDATVYIPFATYDKDDGSSITLTGLAVTDIEIYKNGSAIQRASDAGYTLLDTDGIDFDSIVGIHGFSVDLSNNTDAGFYAAGSEYWVIISAITVDGVVVSFPAATFSIERSGGAIAQLKALTTSVDTLSEGLLMQATTIATLATQTSFTLAAGSADNNAYNGATVVVVDATTGTQKAFGSASDYVGSTKTLTLAQDPGIFTMAVSDKIYILPSDVFAIWDRTLSGATHNIPSSSGRRLRAIGDVVSGAVDDASATTTSFITDLPGTQTNHYADQTLRFTGGNLAGMSRSVLAYDFASGRVTIEEVLPEAPADTDTFDINPVHIHPVSQIVDAVWDEVITPGAHNVTGSAAKFLRTVQAGGYSGGAVWIDTVGGTAGTTDYENGIVTNPSDTITDATTIAASIGLIRFQLTPGSNITLAQAYTDNVFIGYGATIALGGQNCNNSHFIGCDISGISTAANEIEFYNCEMGVCSLDVAHFYDCALESAITVTGIGDYKFVNCHSAIAGTGAPSLDFGAAVGATNVNFRNYSGGIEIKNMQATDNMSLEGNGQLIINANCTGGTIVIRGNFTVTDNTGGAVTLSDDARIDIQQIADAVYDETTSGHSTAGTFGKLLTDMLEDTNELQGNQGDWATAVGFSTHSAGDVWTTVIAESYATNGAAATPAQLFYMTYSVVQQFLVSGTAINLYKLDGTTIWGSCTTDDAINPTKRTRSS